MRGAPVRRLRYGLAWRKFPITDGARRRSNGMDQQEADDKHHRAGDAMNEERSRLRSARPQIDGHVAKRDDGFNEENYAY